MSKYGNKKTVIDGITFDSKAEARRYTELKILEAYQVITELERQPEFVLQPSFKRDGKTIRAIKYRGDFRYREGAKVVVEDVKGARTQVFDLKAKIFQFKYPDIELRITA